MSLAKFSFWKEFLAKISKYGPTTRGVFGVDFLALRLEPLLLPAALTHDFARLAWWKAAATACL
jgi:hypothetical protein